MSLAQRYLPLRPPPETWGDSEFQHRRGIAIPGPFGAANRAASSKQARFIRHWRRFACFPHTPLKRPDQGACGPPILDYTPGGVGLRPLPFGFPSRGRERQRKEKQFHSVTTPKAAPTPSDAGKQFSVSPGYSAPGTGLQVCTAPATTTPVFVQTCPKGRLWT